jgi:hypothetical protein
MKGKGIVILLLLAVMVLFATSQAMALVGCNTGGGGTWIDNYVFPNTSGTKVTGTITLYYSPPYTPEGTTDVLTDFSYVFRVNSALWPNWKYAYFSGTTTGVEYSDLNAQFEIICKFISQNVIPVVIPSATPSNVCPAIVCPGPQCPNTQWYIKNYSSFVPYSTDEASMWLNEVADWFMFDFMLAVPK